MTPDLALVVDNDPDAVKAEALSWPDRASALVVRDADSYVNASEMLKGIKSLRARIAETFDPHITRAHQAHKALVKEKADAEAPLTLAESTLKRALVTYDQEQERIRQAEQRRLEEEARKREEERRLADAAALESEAKATGDDDLLAEALAMVETPVETPVVTVAKATPKVAGISYRETWSASVVDVRKLIQHVAAHPDLVHLLAPNMTALNQMARALKGNLALPGVKAECKRDVASRGQF